MKTRSIRSLTLYFDAEEAPAAELIGNACARSLDVIRDLWGLEPPADCRVYVMTSWPRFLFHAAPWPWRIYLALTLPLRYVTIQKVWAMAGGWALHYGQRHAIGIKPPHLLREADPGLRDRVFVPRSLEEAVAHNTCHELVHACSDHLRLPRWLHEGLAMVTVDRFAGKPTVRADTRQALAGRAGEGRPQGGHARAASDPDSLLYLAVRGYWITRYLAEVHPALLRRQLARRQSQDAVEGALAAGLGVEPGEFWHEIDNMVMSHF
ncbi:MAG: hypothetical protein PVG11_04060 [Anaerolineae bacterium]|jgi:hypothetical protein